MPKHATQLQNAFRRRQHHRTINMLSPLALTFACTVPVLFFVCGFFRAHCARCCNLAYELALRAVEGRRPGY
jgi:hypothetical protein